MEPLGRPEIPDGGESGPGGVRDEVVGSLDNFGVDQNRDDGGEFLNGDIGGQVDPSFVQGLLDRAEKTRIGVVQA